VHKVFRVHPPVGLTSILIGEATHDEAVIVTEVPNLSLLPCGPIPPNPAELLHSQKATEFMAFLRTQYDRIVFDSPPITAVTDALALGPQLDGVVLVVRVRQTRRDQAADVLRQLRALGSKVVGCVVNGIEPNDSNSYYYTGQYNYSSHPNDAAGGSSDARP
jgi:capsular exopolysaccharide synthesis family protein